MSYSKQQPVNSHNNKYYWGPYFKGKICRKEVYQRGSFRHSVFIKSVRYHHLSLFPLKTIFLCAVVLKSNAKYIKSRMWNFNHIVNNTQHLYLHSQGSGH